MNVRALTCLALALLAGGRAHAEFSAEKLALIDRPFLGETAALSPDGQHLAYTDYDGDKLRLIVLDLEKKVRRELPLDEPKNKQGATVPRLAALRWAGPDRLVLVNADTEVMAIDPDGRNPRRLWEKDQDGLIQDRYLRREPYLIAAGLPRLLPPAAGDPGHILLESVATIGPESFSNLYRIDVRTGEAEVVNDADYLNWQVAAYGRGDMLVWPPMPNGNWSLMIARVTDPPPWGAVEAMRDTPFAIRMRLEMNLMMAGEPSLTPETGAAISISSSSNGRMLYDRQGHPRVLYTEDTDGGTRGFLYFAPGQRILEPNITPDGLDKTLGQPKAKEFVLSTSNYFGERSYPLGFDFDPNLLYYASNVGRDTFGIYALNLSTKERTEVAPNLKGVDLASGDPEETDGILVFDETRQKLVGLRYATVRPRTFWLDPELGELQARLDREDPRHVVEILSWDADRRRFLLRLSADDDPGALFLWHRADERMEFVSSATPWLASTPLNPATAFAFTTPGGVSLSGYLTLPNDPKLKPPPLLIYLQGGLWDRAEPGFSRETEMLADLGVAVMRLNYRGSTGFGRAHLTAIQQGIDTIPTEDIVAAVDWLNTRWKIDRERVILMGEGLGGYLALRALQLHPDVFRCGISVNAPTNLSAWTSWQQIKNVRPMYRDGGIETPSTDFRTEVRRAFVKQIKRGNASATGRDAPDRDVLVIESSNSSETTPFSSLLGSIGLGSGGVDLQHLYITGDFKGGTLATRTKVFQRIDEFLNATLYDYAASIGPLKVLEEKPPAKK
jgi:acetyl esterase/lipase